MTIIKSPDGHARPRVVQQNSSRPPATARKKPFKCVFHCVKTCEQEKTPYCIAAALINAMKGNLERGFAFCGANVARVDAIRSVHELMTSLQQEFEARRSARA